MTAQPTRSQKKHTDLLWAAIRLFAAQGVGHTTTREIAAAANTTERTLFKHFGSKDGLVRAVIAEAVVPHLAGAALADVQALIGQPAPALAQWHAHLLERRRAALEAQPELSRLLLMELLRDPAVRADFGRQWQARVWEPLLELLSRLQAEGAVAGDIPAPTLARLFLSINMGYLIGRVILAPDAGWDDSRDIADLAAFFARGAGAAR